MRSTNHTHSASSCSCSVSILPESYFFPFALKLLVNLVLVTLQLMHLLLNYDAKIRLFFDSLWTFVNFRKKKSKKTWKKFGEPLRIPQIFKNQLLLPRSKQLVAILVTFCLKQFHESLALLDPNHQVLFGTPWFGIRKVETSDGSLAILIWHTL